MRYFVFMMGKSFKLDKLKTRPNRRELDEEWKSYEEVAAHILNKMSTKFGLENVEQKKAVKGLRSGTKWNIEAKGTKIGNQGFVIIECRRQPTSRQKQENLGGLAYRIIDSGAVGGIIVTPLPLQKGARKVASAEKIIHVRLHPSSNTKNYIVQFLHQIFWLSTETVNTGDTNIAILTNTKTLEKKNI